MRRRSLTVVRTHDVAMDTRQLNAVTRLRSSPVAFVDDVCNISDALVPGLR